MEIIPNFPTKFSNSSIQSFCYITSTWNVECERDGRQRYLWNLYGRVRDERARTGIGKSVKAKAEERKKRHTWPRKDAFIREEQRAENVGTRCREIQFIIDRSMQIISLPSLIFIGRDETSPTSCCNTLRIDRET